MVVLRIANVQVMPGSTHYLDMAWTWAGHRGAGRGKQMRRANSQIHKTFRISVKLTNPFMSVS